MNENIIVLAELFKALGDVNRLRIIKILASNEDNTFCVSQIADMLGISQPASSQHLAVLKRVGLLSSEQQGKKMFYALNGQVFRRYFVLVEHMFEMAFVKCDLSLVQGKADCDRTSLISKEAEYESKKQE